MKAAKCCSIVITVFFILILSVEMIIPVPSSAADLQLKWHQLDTPGSVAGKNDIVSPCEVNNFVIGSDGQTFYAVDIPCANSTTGEKTLYKSTDGGISWSDDAGKYLYESMSAAEHLNFTVWYVAVAPDNVNLVAAATNDASSKFPRKIWLSDDGGITWNNASFPVSSNISAIAISPSVENIRNIAAGIRTGIGTGNVWIADIQRSFNWIQQDCPGDILCLKFSPSYPNDNTIVAILSDVLGTYFSAGLHDAVVNRTDWAAIYYQSKIEVTVAGAGNSPKANQIISADLSLPSTYSGQTTSTRRYFISIDSPATDAGIYRFDDASGNQLMKATNSKRISSIAYYGTENAGKLLAGEVYGNACSASVMTWFTDTPFKCGAPCWGPALNPPTGGAATGTTSYGNARVAWSPDGKLAFAGTASTDTLTGGWAWPNAFLSGAALDESAFSRSYDNGLSWASLSLIDTCVSNLVDISPSPDCTMVYLASINTNPNLSGFDSVWRSKSTPLGTEWERILCAMTNGDNCTANQTDIAILRLAGDKPDGEVLVWLAPGTNLIKWSVNYGDSWNNLGTRYPVQDAAVEDSATLYALSMAGDVQKFSYSGTGWIARRIKFSGIDPAYSITTAYTGMTPDNDKGVVIVGGAGTGVYDVAYSTDNGTSFTQIVRNPSIRDKTMVVASSGFKSDGYILAINAGGMYAYSIYTTGYNRWEEWWGGTEYGYPVAVTGLSISRNGSYYFSDAYSPYIRWNYASAGLGSTWLSLGSSPTTRWRTCGGLELGQPTITYVIDQQPFSPPTGGVWYYIDDLLWSGPTPTSPVNYFNVDCDPVTGRVDAVELKWLPRSLSNGYDIHIAKDIDFYMTVAKIGDVYGEPYIPPELDSPTLYIPPGGGTVTDDKGNSWTVPELETGHTYYWKAMVKSVATGDYITSPWSWRESFNGQPGYKVRSPYPGPTLLSPSNGCEGCFTNPAFSWSSYQKAKGYEFVLATDPDMQQVLIHATISTAAYEYGYPLAGDTVYFWHVRAVDANDQPVSDWSATFCFRTTAIDNSAPPGHEEKPTPPWVWATIATGIVLIIITSILIIRN